MALPRFKARGERGSWFAVVNGERLPCVHRHWLSGMHYHDPHYADEPKWRELVREIAVLGKVVLTTDRIHADGRGFDRTGYVAVFRIANLDVIGTDLQFDLVERVAQLE